MKKTSTLLFFFLLAFSVTAQDLTPDRFLGYPLGSKFTYHHRVLDYFKALSDLYPDKIKLLPYGSTYEGRPLLVAVIASPENLKNIESIRTNHLKSIGLIDGTAQGNSPAIAWLSYNVHGNEAVSSEASMKTAYELLNKENTLMQSVLSNTVVIIDPCVNPDGHERYAQWYNRVAAAQPDPLDFAWEHTEPWPGGRFNHYMADLNRDWAWQQQKESKERLILYNQWMPHLHADFHEMNSESSYYFPPAAKPYHQDITPWQRSFNNTLGEFNRKYFDKNGWLYYTRYDFDLFYPSYGDTWPTYNGAIGVTYEQAGGGRAGLAILRKNEGDTLTLRERILHHYATSLATLEAISSQAEQTVQEFIKYYAQSRTTPIGMYKTYVIKTAGFEGQNIALRTLLDNQGIRYGVAGKTLINKGTNLATAKEENLKIEPEDLLIGSSQPKSTLLKILFEPNPELEDSLTYDITTWGLTYALGLKAYGIKEKLLPLPYKSPGVSNALPVQTPYAYLAGWSSFQDLKFLAKILQQKIKVRSAQSPFELGGIRYKAGTLIITRKGNEALEKKFDQIVNDVANEFQVKLTPTNTGFVSAGFDIGANQVQPIKQKRVVLIGGESISPLAFGEVWHFFEQQLKYPVTVIEGKSLSNNLPWNNIDVLIFPSGNYTPVLNDKILANLREWISNGGTLIAMENALNFFADRPDFDLKRKKVDEKKEKIKKDPLKTWASGEREFIRYEPLGAVYKVNLDTTHPLAFGYTDFYYALVQKSWNFEYLQNGWNVGYIKEKSKLAGFAGSNATEELVNTPILASQDIGRGKIIFMADNPLFRGFWYGGKLMFGNALFR